MGCREAAAERERKAAAAMLRLAGTRAQAEGKLGALQLQQEGLRLGRLLMSPSGPLGSWPGHLLYPHPSHHIRGAPRCACVLSHTCPQIQNAVAQLQQEGLRLGRLLMSPSGPLGDSSIPWILLALRPTELLSTSPSRKGGKGPFRPFLLFGLMAAESSTVLR